MLTLETQISLSNKKIRTILRDAEKSAAAVNLIYVRDNKPGINRVKEGDKFIYRLGAKIIKNADQLLRIKKLMIPPAWENVWICPSDNGHLQATGIDAKKRKQYKYHALWNSLRNQTKFYKLHEFGQTVPIIRRHLEKDLLLPGLPQEKVLAAVVRLMEQTSIRIGNNLYEKLYGSFGLTTLKDRHVKIEGQNLWFTFKGKKGVSHRISLKSKRLANIVKKCRDIPGKELFQYYDDKGQHRCIDSGMVNNYIKNICEHDFSAKDFRTWAGTVHALTAFREVGCSDTAAGVKKNVVSVLDSVANHLGNTRTVCKKYYVHPVLITLYESRRLADYFSASEGESPENNITDLTTGEKLLMKILNKEGLTL